MKLFKKVVSSPIRLSADVKTQTLVSLLSLAMVLIFSFNIQGAYAQSQTLMQAQAELDTASVGLSNGAKTDSLNTSLSDNQAGLTGTAKWSDQKDDGVLVGNVYDNDSGQLVYVEQHSIRQDPSTFVMETHYFDTEQKLIAEREVEYDGDRVETYLLKQPSLNLLESIERTPTGLLITATKNGQLTTKAVEYPNPENIVIDAGFDDFVVRVWDELMSGETVEFPFASTGRMDVVNLQLKRVQISNTVLEDAGKARFEMNAANPLLRWLLDPVVIEYFIDSRELASYRGISNLKNADLENYNAYVEFERDERFSDLSARENRPLKSRVSSQGD